MGKALLILFFLQIVKNGIYKSIDHGDKERISIATFFSPKLDGDLGPAPSLLTPQNIGGLEWPITSKDFFLESSMENHTYIL